MPRRTTRLDPGDHKDDNQQEQQPRPLHLQSRRKTSNEINEKINDEINGKISVREGGETAANGNGGSDGLRSPAYARSANGGGSGMAGGSGGRDGGAGGGRPGGAPIRIVPSVSPPSASPPSSNRSQDRKRPGRKKPRLIVVTNRLPVSVQKPNKNSSTGKKDNKPKLKISDGGLVSALSNLSSHYDMEWIGWVGSTVDPQEQLWVKSELAKKNCHPVFLKQEVAEGYYNGFCNNVLWPLFHYISVPIEGIKLASKQWGAYCEANTLFGKTVLEVWQEGDIVWVHDYHLMLLPSILRAAHPSILVGFFSHIPFPSSEIYRVLPVRKEILEGLLCSNLVGFHTHDYVRHFESTCVRTLGTSIVEKGVRHRDRVTHVAAFPIGINPSKFLDCLKTEPVKTRLRELRTMYKGQKLILGVDRLDYIKGIPLKLKAVERFFQDNPKWIGKLVLLQIAVPSRGAVNEYKKLKRQTHELVGRINGKYGSFETGVPIHYLDKTVPFDQLCALYRFADALLVTSVRDGMNLVSYEYIVCQKEKHGVLILSEFAGAAQSLGAGCVQVNPWNVNECADAIKYALEMSPEEKKRFHTYAFQHVYTHDTQAWAKEFLSSLKAVDDMADNNQATLGTTEFLTMPVQLSTKQVKKEFASSQQRLVIYGVHGTLSHTIRQEGLTTRGFGYLQVADKVKSNVSALAADPNTTLVLLSSSSRAMLEKAFGDTQAWLGAENGFFLSRPPGSGSDTEEEANYDHDDRKQQISNVQQKRVWEVTQENVNLSWKRKVYEFFEYFRERTPSSFIRNQETSIEWHYHDVKDKVFAKTQANELVSYLRSGPLLNTNTEIVDTDSIVRIRHLGVSKGAGAVKIIEQIQQSIERDNMYYDMESPDGFDLILCVGNLATGDEDLFVMLNSIRFLDQEIEHPLADIWDLGSEGASNMGPLGRSCSCPDLSQFASVGLSQLQLQLYSFQNPLQQSSQHPPDDPDGRRHHTPQSGQHPHHQHGQSHKNKRRAPGDGLDLPYPQQKPHQSALQLPTADLHSPAQMKKAQTPVVSGRKVRNQPLKLSSRTPVRTYSPIHRLRHGHVSKLKLPPPSLVSSSSSPTKRNAFPPQAQSQPSQMVRPRSIPSFQLAQQDHHNHYQQQRTPRQPSQHPQSISRTPSLPAAPLQFPPPRAGSSSATPRTPSSASFPPSLPPNSSPYPMVLSLPHSSSMGTGLPRPSSTSKLLPRAPQNNTALLKSPVSRSLFGPRRDDGAKGLEWKNSAIPDEEGVESAFSTGSTVAATTSVSELLRSHSSTCSVPGTSQTHVSGLPSSLNRRVQHQDVSVHLPNEQKGHQQCSSQPSRQLNPQDLRVLSPSHAVTAGGGGTGSGGDHGHGAKADEVPILLAQPNPDPIPDPSTCFTPSRRRNVKRPVSDRKATVDDEQMGSLGLRGTNPRTDILSEGPMTPSSSSPSSIPNVLRGLPPPSLRVAPQSVGIEDPPPLRRHHQDSGRADGKDPFSLSAPISHISVSEAGQADRNPNGIEKGNEGSEVFGAEGALTNRSSKQEDNDEIGQLKAPGDLKWSVTPTSSKAELKSEVTGGLDTGLHSLGGASQASTANNRVRVSRTDADAELVPHVSVYTVTVGKRKSHAHYYLPNMDDPVALLEKLSVCVRESVRL